MIAALYVQTNGCYFGLPDVDPWDKGRDARRYAGPHPIIAHPPCERWGKYWHGSPRKPHQFKLGDDDGCFRDAIRAVRTWRGVLEHPEGSRAWEAFGLPHPPRAGGWLRVGQRNGWTCCVEQGHYGHAGRKATWLYVYGLTEPPELTWGSSGQRLDPKILERHGYEYARRCGITAMIGGKDKSILRAATPIEFRDLLLSMVRPLAAGRAAA